LEFDLVAIDRAGNGLDDRRLHLLAGSVLSFNLVVARDNQMPAFEFSGRGRFDAPPTPEHTGRQMSVRLLDAQPTGSAAWDGQLPTAQEGVFCRDGASRRRDEGKTKITTTQVAGGIKRISAAVTVAQMVKGTGATREFIKRDPKEMTKIENIAKNVLGIDTTRGDQITVEEMPFNDQFATEVTRNLETQERRDLWWTVGRNVAYPALALGILVVFMRLFKRTSSEEIALGMPVGRMGLHAGNGNGNGNGHQFDLGNNENGNEVVTVEVLNQLIKENPQNMTQAIRSWLNRGTPSNQ